MKKTLLLIPSVLKSGIEAEVAEDRHPVMDYYALAQALRETHGCTVDILDYAAAEADPSPGTRLAARTGGLDAALAWMGFQRRRDYAAIFSNGENVGIPLALLLGRTSPGPRHVTIGHRLSTGKKQLFFTKLGVQRRMDRIFVYAKAQEEWGRERLGIAPETLALIPFHADAKFYRPLPDCSRQPQPDLRGGAGMARLSDSD